MTPAASSNLHAKLRTALADGPITLGDLRREYGFDPSALLRNAVGQFPDAYIDSTDAEGRPTLAPVLNVPAQPFFWRSRN